MTDEPDLGFTCRTRADGAVDVFHQGRLATTLRGRAADNFNRVVTDPTSRAAQQRMARVTGNYKRGNERRAGSHPRNAS